MDDKTCLKLTSEKITALERELEEESGKRLQRDIEVSRQANEIDTYRRQVTLLRNEIQKLESQSRKAYEGYCLDIERVLSELERVRAEKSK